VDVNYLKNFYSSALGHLVYDDVTKYIEKNWPHFFFDGRSDTTNLGVGYAMPFVDYKKNFFFAIPSEFGKISWPPLMPNLVASVNENNLPFHSNTFDNIICVHSLEFCKDEEKFLKEINRILKPKGKILLILPNLYGMWANSDNNPLAKGRSYSMLQAYSLLQNNNLTPTDHRRGLFLPPKQIVTNNFKESFYQKANKTWANFADSFFNHFGSLIYIQATKNNHSNFEILETTRLKFKAA